MLQLFTEKGYQPVSAGVITDRDTGRSRGYGFVELGPEDDAKSAIGTQRHECRRPRAPGQRSASARIPWLVGIVPVTDEDFLAGVPAAVVETIS